MRPEDVELAPAAQRRCAEHGIALGDLREARANVGVWDRVGTFGPLQLGEARGTLPDGRQVLIALSLQDDFLLPMDRAPDWYGISRDTARAGLRGLLSRGFLSVRSVRKPAPLTAAGHTYERRYTLRAPFRPASSETSPA